MSKKVSTAKSKKDTRDGLETFSATETFNYAPKPYLDISSMPMRQGHENKPIWVTADGHVFLETFSPIYKQAYDFLIAIAEPVCRPTHIHEYQITPYSLYAAASLGLQTDDIIKRMTTLSKNVLPEGIKHIISEGTTRCGKVRLCLKKKRYFVESQYPEILMEMLTNDEIKAARVDAEGKVREMPPYPPDVVSERRKQEYREGWLKTEIKNMQYDRDTGFIVWGTNSQTERSAALILPGTKGKEIDQMGAMGMHKHAGVEDLNKKVYAFEIEIKDVPMMKDKASAMRYPMLEEYDFLQDTSSPSLPIGLRPSAALREYQEKSLHKMFGHRRARSGMIVLPCGAGKTLVGITATATVRKSTLVFCTTSMAVLQWKRQYEKWTTLDSNLIFTFTKDNKPEFDKSNQAMILITTYSMMAFAGHRDAKGKAVMQEIHRHEWGLIVLDEVHVAPANMFRKCVNDTHSRCKLGLTATLVREDDKIEDLFFLVGPKLYEANWLDLTNQGNLARVNCIEVWCEMTAAFYQAYLDSDHNKQRLLYVMNPNKLRACEYLIKRHEKRGDKILVYSDNVYALQGYAKMLGKPEPYPFISGATNHKDRVNFLHEFQFNEEKNVLFVSKIGDNSIDLPDANVLIQISSHFSARRQEAQRLGRILRPKNAEHGRYDAFFYTLVSNDTHEMKYAAKRQSFLVNQGYAFQVLNTLPDMQQFDLQLSDEESQRELLKDVMTLGPQTGEIEIVDEDGFYQPSDGGFLGAQRNVGSMAAYSGAATTQSTDIDLSRYRNKKRKFPLASIPQK